MSHSASPAAADRPQQQEQFTADATDLLADLSLSANAKEQQSSSSYLTPLQHSLVFEITTRRRRIARAQQRIDFWKQYEEKNQDNETNDGTIDPHRRDRFGADVVDEAFFDDLIQQGKERLAKVQQAQRLKEAIVDSADAAHAINASMSSVPPADYAEDETPLCIHTNLAKDKQPLRSLVARRDQLSLQFLQKDEQIKRLRAKRRTVLQQINEARQKTSSLVRDVHAEKRALTEQRQANAFLDGTSGAATSASQGQKEVLVGAQRRIDKLQEALNVARGKREMIKGVLRGVILESGLDWYGNKKMRSLMLSLGDEDLNSSDEEVDLYSDEEEAEKESLDEEMGDMEQSDQDKG